MTGSSITVRLRRRNKDQAICLSASPYGPGASYTYDGPSPIHKMRQIFAGCTIVLSFMVRVYLVYKQESRGG